MEIMESSASLELPNSEAACKVRHSKLKVQYWYMKRLQHILCNGVTYAYNYDRCL